MPSDPRRAATLAGHLAVSVAIELLRHRPVGVAGRRHTEAHRVASVGHREDELTALAQVAYMDRGVGAVVVVPELHLGHVISGRRVSTHVDWVFSAALAGPANPRTMTAAEPITMAGLRNRIGRT